MSLTSTAVTATTTRGLIGGPKKSRRQLTVFNDGAATAYIGGATVTASSGYPLAPSADVPFDVFSSWDGDDSPGMAFYAITASGTAALRVTEIAF